MALIKRHKNQENQFNQTIPLAEQGGNPSKIGDLLEEYLRRDILATRMGHAAQRAFEDNDMYEYEASDQIRDMSVQLRDKARKKINTRF